jgi:hypothetical protein
MTSGSPPRAATPQRTNAVATWIKNLGAKGRLAVALAIAVVAYVAEPESISWHTRLVASWDAGAILYLCLA